MKVNVELPEGASEVAADEISPQSTVVVDAIVKAVISATQGKEIDPEIVKDIIQSVKETVETLVASGAVQIPSMVVEAPKDDSGNYVTSAADLVTAKKVKFADNDGLDEVSGALVTNNAVAEKIDIAKVEIEVRELKKIDTADDGGKRELVRKIFSRLLGDGEVPEYIVDFFASEYAAGKTVEMGELFKSVYSGLQLNPRFGLALTDLNLSSAKASQAFSELLDTIYDLEDKKRQGSISEEEQKILAEIPGVITVAFPSDDWRGVQIVEETSLTIPQGIVFTIFITDRFVPEVFKEVTGYELEPVMEIDDHEDEGMGADVGEQPGQKVTFEDPVEFDPGYYDPSGANPGLLQLLGFFDESNLARLDGVEITHVGLMPGRLWVDDGQGGMEYPSLQAEVCFTDLSAFRQMMNADSEVVPQSHNYNVVLHYPKSDGSAGQVALFQRPDMILGFDPAAPEGGVDQAREGGEACFILDPWMKAQMEGRQPGAADLVSDFVSGSYKVVVMDGGGVVAERSMNKKIISGMLDAVPQLLSPRGMPQWPKECNGVEGYCQAWDNLMREWNAAGGNTTFAINTDSDGDGVEDKARVVIKWAKPDVVLPDGVEIAYSVDIFRNGGCTESGDCDFESIYSSQEKGRRIFGRSLEVPKLLEKLEIGEGSYNVNVCAEFIDMENGDFLGGGGCSFAEFNVGEPLDMSSTFEIVGEAAVEDPAWKIALISEPMPEFGQEPVARKAPTTLLVSPIEGGSYGLSPTIGDFLEKPVNTIFNVVMFKDDDGDDEIDFPAEGQPGEPVIWPRWEDQIRFETWGHVLRAVKEERGDNGFDFKRHEVVIVGGEEVEGPRFDELVKLPEVPPSTSGENGSGDGDVSSSATGDSTGADAS